MFRPRFLAVSALLALLALPVFSAERVKVWIALRDKGPVVSAPSATSPRAFEDAPVYAPYLETLRGAGVEIATVLKWQNRVSGWVEASRTGTVAGLSCVRGVEEMPRKAAVVLPEPQPGVSAPSLAKAAFAPPQDFGAFGSLFASVGAEALRDTLTARGLKPGEGIRIAVMDGDFHLGHQAFDSLFARGGLIDQWDFVTGSPVAVSRTLANSHGAAVLSQIGGDLPGVLQGLAPYAKFLLYRTEDEPTESYVEEDYLAAAFERAVDSGAQVISISLGYRYDFDSEANYPYAQMDGRTRPSSIAAVGAARRGALVVVAIGNEGLTRGGFPTVTAPSDADSILAVGALTATGARCSYASTGPSYDGRIKPELSSLGCSMPLANSSTATGTWNQSGTSFAAPVVAGIAALLRQLHPDSAGGGAQAIRNALMQSARFVDTTLPPDTVDNLVGHGLVRAAQAHCLLQFHTGCAIPPTSIAVKGIYVWRGGNAVPFDWQNRVNLGKLRAWDLQGRAVGITGGWDKQGNSHLTSPGRRAPSPLVLKIPVK